MISFYFLGNKTSPGQLSTQNLTYHGVKMRNKKEDVIDQKLQDLNNDGVDRRGFLKCMAWAGTGLVWTMSGGIPASKAFASIYGKGSGKGGDFSFVQISDSHIGFNKPANPDVTGTLQAAIDKINALPQQPDFIMHTGDLTPSVEAERIRHARPGAEGRIGKAGLLRARRARHAERRRQAVSRALWQRHEGPWLVQLRSQGRAFRRPGQRRAI